MFKQRTICDSIKLYSYWFQKKVSDRYDRNDRKTNEESELIRNDKENSYAVSGGGAVIDNVYGMRKKDQYTGKNAL